MLVSVRMLQKYSTLPLRLACSFCCLKGKIGEPISKQEYIMRNMGKNKVPQRACMVIDYYDIDLIIKTYTETLNENSRFSVIKSRRTWLKFYIKVKKELECMVINESS